MTVMRESEEAASGTCSGVINKLYCTTVYSQARRDADLKMERWLQLEALAEEIKAENA
jgi:hypothetical protein